MKKFDFNHLGKSWDRFNAFHAFNRNIVEFETGEVMVVGFPDPDDRHEYPKFGIHLATTTDAHCPDLYFDKECTQLVKKAWLTWKGQQHLAIDLEQGVAVPLFSKFKRKTTVLGYHVQTATAYWAGAERLPHPLGGKITIHTPDSVYKKKVLRILNQVQVAVTAAYRMKERKDWWSNGQYPAKLEWQDMTTEEIVTEICQDGSVMRDVAMKGFKLPRECQAVDYLYVKGEK